MYLLNSALVNSTNGCQPDVQDFRQKLKKKHPQSLVWKMPQHQGLIQSRPALQQGNVKTPLGDTRRYARKMEKWKLYFILQHEILLKSRCDLKILYLVYFELFTLVFQCHYFTIFLVISRSTSQKSTENDIVESFGICYDHCSIPGPARLEPAKYNCTFDCLF